MWKTRSRIKMGKKRNVICAFFHIQGDFSQVGESIKALNFNHDILG